MTDSEAHGITISFTCPVCEQDVTLTESTGWHKIKIDGEDHGVTWKGTPDHECPVYFENLEHEIRSTYDFIGYEIPTIFTTVPETVTDQDVLQSLIDAVVTRGVGVAIKVELQDRDGERKGRGMAYGWYHDKKPSYYGFTRGIRTPQNAIMTESRREFAEFLERWFYFNKDYARPDTDYGDYNPDGENQSLEDF